MRCFRIPALFLVLVLLVAALASGPTPVSAATKSASKNKNGSKNKNKNKNKNSSSSRTTAVTAAAAPKCTNGTEVCFDGTKLTKDFTCGNTQVGSSWALAAKCDNENFFPCRISPNAAGAFTTTCGTVTLTAEDKGSSGVKITGVDTENRIAYIGAALLKGGNGYCTYNNYPDDPTATTFPRTPKNCGTQLNQCGLSHADVCVCVPKTLTWSESANSIESQEEPLCPGTTVASAVLTAVDNCGNTFSADVSESTSSQICGVFTTTYTVTHPNNPSLTLTKTTTYEIDDWVIPQTDDALCSKKFVTKCLGALTVTRQSLEISDCKLKATYDDQYDACGTKYTLRDEVALGTTCSV